ncbi:MAG: SDR family oxidoreductase [Solirubrobacterales bacterium]
MIEGKVVGITGASSGIGEALARYLAVRGAKVVLGARREDRLAEVARQIADDGGEAAYEAVDISRRDGAQSLVDLATKTYGQLDVLISNAGAMPISRLDDLCVDDWETMVDVNVKGVLHGIGAALPVFRAQSSGHFVNVASTAAFRTVAGQAVYSGTKVAVRAISEGLRVEAGKDLRVTIISPGFTHTEGVGKGSSPEARAELEAARDAFAMPPEAVARAVAFAIEQPADIDIGEIVIRSTAQA